MAHAFRTPHSAFRILMMGTGPFAVPTFRGLLAGPHEVLALVTRPSIVGPGRRQPARNPMRETAGEAHVRVLEPVDVNAAAVRSELALLRPDLLVVCDYGQILSDRTLEIAPLGGINLHGSLLPKYRGAAPVNWAILRGESETGVSVIHMTPRLDAGPCLVQRRTEIVPEESAPALEARLADLGVTAVMQAIGQLAGWDRQSPLGAPQDGSLASRAPRLQKRDGEVDWARRAEEIARQVRGLKPWPGTYTHWLRGDSRTLRLILEQVSVQPRGGSALPPGTVARADGDALLVAAGDDCLSLERVQPAGKRVMSASEFLRGYPIAPQDRLGRIANPV